jgi:malonyl-CoA decarboxylase
MQNFATLSPIPGLMQWLLAKLASQIKLSEAESREGNSLGACSTFKESILLPDEERMIHDAMYVRSEAMSEIELHL